jgi:hypothetical protein
VKTLLVYIIARPCFYEQYLASRNIAGWNEGTDLRPFEFGINSHLHPNNLSIAEVLNAMVERRITTPMVAHAYAFVVLWLDHHEGPPVFQGERLNIDMERHVRLRRFGQPTAVNQLFANGLWSPNEADVARIRWNLGRRASQRHFAFDNPNWLRVGQDACIMYLHAQPQGQVEARLSSSTPFDSVYPLPVIEASAAVVVVPTGPTSSDAVLGSVTAPASTDPGATESSTNGGETGPANRDPVDSHMEDGELKAATPPVPSEAGVPAPTVVPGPQ